MRLLTLRIPPVSNISISNGVSLLILALIVTLTSTGCKTFQKYKCNSKDWNEIGRQDGAAGKIMDETFPQYYNDCAAVGSELDISIYAAGYQAGFATYCTEETGYREALEGLENRHICEADFGTAFNDGFANGLVDLCTASGGQRHGLEGKSYKGTCPAESQQEFLRSYVNALEVALPEATSQVAILEGKSSRLSSDISYIETEEMQYSNAIDAAKKSGNKTYQEELESAKSVLSARKSGLTSTKSRTDSQLADARAKSATIKSMLLKWKLELDT